MTDISTNPYPGLRTFEYSENHLFFGRDGQAQEVADKMQQSHFVAVVGTSGSGKSSLVRAGLLPFLHGGKVYQTGSRWRISVMRPGEAPIRNLAKALAYPESFDSDNDQFQHDETRIGITDSILRRSGVGILDFYRTADFAQDENLLIVVDQFEEIFRFQDKLGAQDSDEAIAFVKLLLAAAVDPEFPIYVVITMRSDFLGDCAEFRDLPEAINKGQYLIPRLTRDQLRQAIESPAMVYDAEISPVLVNRLLNDLEQEQNQSVDLRERMLRDRLPVLQHVLMRMWNRWEAFETPDQPIDLEQYEDPAIGGMSKALSNHADEAYAELTDDQKTIAEKMFKCLTETDSEGRQIRRVTSLQELCSVTRVDKADMVAVIDIFRREGRTFVMPPPHVELTDDTKIDISHESLIRNWELLKKWVKEEAEDGWQYRRLCEDAGLWEANEGSFWGGRVLEIALDWRDKFRPTRDWAARYQFFTDEEKHLLAEAGRVSPNSERDLHREIVGKHFAESMTFLDASADEEERIKKEKEFYVTSLERQTRTARIFTVISLCLMVAAVLSSIIAFTMWGRANDAAFETKLALDETERLLTAVTVAKASEKTQREIAEQQTLIAKQKEEEAVELANRRLLAEQNAELQRKKAEAEAAKNLQLAKENERIATDLRTSLNDLGVKNAQAQANLNGLISFEKEEFDDAERNFRNLLLDPLQLIKRTEEQKTDADRVEIDYNWWATHNLATIYDKQDKFDDAVAHFKAALGTLGYQLKSPNGSDVADAQISNSASAVATLHRYADFYRDRAKVAAADVKGRDLARRDNTSAVGIYKNLIAYLDRVCQSAGTKDNCKKNIEFQARIEIELGETHSDLTEYQEAGASFQRSYEHYKRFDVDEKAPPTRKARKAWSRAVALRPTDDSFTILAKEAQIREINKRLLETAPLDLDNSDVYLDLSRANQVERTKWQQAHDRLKEEFLEALPQLTRDKVRWEQRSFSNSNYSYDDFETNTAENSFDVNANVSASANANFSVSNTNGVASAVNANGPASNANIEITNSAGYDNTSNAYTNSYRPRVDPLMEHLTDDQKQRLAVLVRRVGEYQEREGIYERVSESILAPPGPGLEGFPEEPETLLYLQRAIGAMEAYREAGECQTAGKVSVELIKRARNERPFTGLLMATMAMIGNDRPANISEIDYLALYEAAIRSDQYDKFLATVAIGDGEGPMERVPFEFVEIAVSFFLATDDYQRARIAVTMSIPKLRDLEKAITNRADARRVTQGTAHLYFMLARIAEMEADTFKSKADKEPRLDLAKAAYADAIRADVEMSRQQVGTEFNPPGFVYKTLFADFLERQNDDEALLKLYAEIRPELTAFVRDDNLDSVLRSGFPSRIYVRMLKRLGDVESAAGRKAAALEFYDRAHAMMEAIYKSPASVAAGDAEATAYKAYGNTLTRPFFTDYVDLLSTMNRLRPVDPTTLADKIRSLNESKGKAPSGETSRRFDLTGPPLFGNRCKPLSLSVKGG